MKRLLFIIPLALICALTIIIGGMKVSSCCSNTELKLDLAYSAAVSGDNERAAELCSQAEREWVSAESTLGLFVNKSHINEAGAKLSSIAPMIENGDTAGFLSAVCELKVLLIHLRHSESS